MWDGPSVTFEEPDCLRVSEHMPPIRKRVAPEAVGTSLDGVRLHHRHPADRGAHPGRDHPRDAEWHDHHRLAQLRQRPLPCGRDRRTPSRVDVAEPMQREPSSALWGGGPAALLSWRHGFDPDGAATGWPGRISPCQMACRAGISRAPSVTALEGAVVFCNVESVSGWPDRIPDRSRWRAAQDWRAGRRDLR